MSTGHEQDSSPAHVDQSVPWLSAILAISTAVIATVIVAVSVHALGAGMTGTVLLIAAFIRGSRWLLTGGIAGLFAGVLVAGVAGGSPELLLVTTLLIVIVWDTGEHAIDLGQQVGRDASTTRVELVKFISSLVMLIIVGGLGYLMFRYAPQRQPMLALVALLIGVMGIIASLQQ